jgi:Lar family restriction alleviation protein
MTNADKLLPCPFCGEDTPNLMEIFHRGFRLECEGCGVHSPIKPDGPSLLEAWNTRAAVTEADRKQCLAALQAHADALAGEMRRSRDGWWNVAELGLVPPQHMHTAIVLADSAAEALRSYEAFKAGEPT